VEGEMREEEEEERKKEKKQREEAASVELIRAMRENADGTIPDSDGTIHKADPDADSFNYTPWEMGLRRLLTIKTLAKLEAKRRPEWEKTSERLKEEKKEKEERESREKEAKEAKEKEEAYRADYKLRAEKALAYVMSGEYSKDIEENGGKKDEKKIDEMFKRDSTSDMDKSDSDNLKSGDRKDKSNKKSEKEKKTRETAAHLEEVLEIVKELEFEDTVPGMSHDSLDTGLKKTDGAKRQTVRPWIDEFFGALSDENLQSLLDIDLNAMRRILQQDYKSDLTNEASTSGKTSTSAAKSAVSTLFGLLSGKTQEDEGK
jgi:hypothetical protein